MPGNDSLFVRKSTGLVREASFLDSAIFVAGVATPVGTALSFGVLYALALFPGTNLLLATAISIALSVPIIITAALLASSMPRTGADYIWVSRIISPPVALVSNFAFVLCTFVTGAYNAKIWGSMSISPSLIILGNVVHNDGITKAGEAAGGTGATIALGILAIVVVALIVGAGTRRMFKLQNAAFGIAMGGTLITLAILLVGDKASFVANFNAYAARFTKSPDSYNAIIDAAKAAGFPSHGGYSWAATVPAIGIMLGWLIWSYESIYLSGEMKSAGKRKRHLSIMFSALIWNAGFIIIGIVLLYKTVGNEFIQSINYLWNYAPDKYPLPVPPYVNFFAGLITSNPVLNILISFSFIFWVIPAILANVFVPIRSLFAWSFDRILPEKISAINEKTHSPVLALVIVTIAMIGVLIWASLSTSFFTLFSVSVLLGYITIVLISLSGVLFPFRKRDLSKSSPANLAIGKVPLITVSGIASILVIAFAVYLYAAYPALGLSSPALVFGIVGAVIVGALLIYYLAYFIQKRRGIDIRLFYKELPPE